MAPILENKLKAQLGNITPTEGDQDSSSPGFKPVKGVNSDGSEVKGKPTRLKELAQDKLDGKTGNPSQLGDPISLKAETNDYEPEETERGADGQRQGRGSKL
ncbi:hypothetical protein B0T11DRAFT_277612 [Plectosphaerella cucumerina]|uniref:Uncharacterized protein n=1 Tax=Plectosphaerella cucumerina TaxID=40658 RepID=A0A8K0X7M4_9PEZI|nr:hypothetical protein B0T11DRAFT_277612 [Plectosphaerella cucumerina]